MAAALLSGLLASGGVALALLPPRTSSAVIPSPVPLGSGTPTASRTAGPGAPGAVSRDASTVIEAIASEASPAVVTITSSISVSGVDPFSIPASGVGSGFIVRSDGWILTNWHVVEGNSSLTVLLDDGRTFDGTVAQSDPDNDLAVVKIEATGLPVVTLGTSTNLEVGQLTVAIGSPLGTYTDSVTSGILSATGRSIEVKDDQTGQPRHLTNLLQTDAAINPGNSGGPLLDDNGRVIGINAAIATSAEGIGFAIPIDAARAIVSKATGSP
jgi:serine protease Do